jgi:hypothetical protein
MNPFANEALAKDRERALSRRFARPSGLIPQRSPVSAAARKVRSTLRGAITRASGPAAVATAQKPAPCPPRPAVVVFHPGPR